MFISVRGSAPKRAAWFNTGKGLVMGACMAASSLAMAAFPDAPIRLVIPFAPGGATDVIGRQLGIELSKKLGQPVVVDNRPGAAGTIGVASVVRAPADGYTLVLASSALVAADPEQEKLPYVPKRDLASVASVVSIPYVVVANTNFAPNNITELIDAAKKAQGRLNFASSGVGSPPHLASELLLAMGGIKVKHIPYKGAVPALTDVAGGQVEFMTCDVVSATAFLQGGKVKALATTGTERMEQLPNVPTVAESGLPGYSADGWFGIFAPAKVPPAVLATLTKAVAEAVQEPDFKKQIAALGGKPLAMAPAQFDKFIADETVKRSNLIRTNNIVLEN